MSKRILTVGGDSYFKALKGLGDLHNSIAEFLSKPRSFDLVLFTGGADVSPKLYGDTSPKNVCSVAPARDEIESEIFKTALHAGVKMTGICRGSQFINVMSGGRMIHHLDRHGGSPHTLSCQAGPDIVVNSYHHQMSIPMRGGHAIAWSTEKRSKEYIGRDDEFELYPGREVEAIYYPNTKCAGVQWHPEMMLRDSDGYRWYFEMVEDFLSCSAEAFGDKYIPKTEQKTAAG